ncbi:hypothetical protein BJQ94_06645 [Cryobacterium sp. SO2]|uniref:hypothetical protein n=1 Tax=Cryobacterium sp. SO2 TaxID=1897060 RepID=UPI00223D1AC9|nr:hypothetical protein [Cryobacterium sp. SO2]WEO78703.1 hypothetical protein BJQ94_06645 [Cryobacterium sp. SO2]
MDDWKEELRRVGELNRNAKPAEAERVLVRVLTQASPYDLSLLNAPIDRLLLDFFPKRRARIEAVRQTSDLIHLPAIAPSSDSSSLATTPIADRTTPDVQAELGEIASLIREVRLDLAENRARALVQELALEDLVQNDAAIDELISGFLPKRQRALRAAVDLRTNASDSAAVELEAKPAESDAPGVPRVVEVELPRITPSVINRGQQSLAAPVQPSRVPHGGATIYQSRTAVTRERFQSDLAELGRFHIFQWATYYRDTLADYFDVFLDELIATESSEALDIVRSCLSSHAREIFRKGFLHVRGSAADDRSYAITKSLAGLQRFLDLPLEFYSSTLQARQVENPKALRTLCSAMICGILQGYAAADFDAPGGQLLPRFPRSWAHTLPFLTTADLEELTPALEAGDFVEGIYDSVRPVTAALDQFIESEPGSAPLPALSQYLYSTRRLDVSLSLPPDQGSRTFDLQCYMSAQFVSADLLEEATARAVHIVVAPLRSDLRARVESVERWSSRVVPVTGLTEIDPSRRLLARLQDLVHETRSDRLDRPITFNWVQTFPLENPSLIKYNHVYRSSVRRLMQSHERRNGVRLWCSVRRSGKTTACTTDLGSTTGGSILVAQTCESTGQLTDGDVFYSEVRRALDEGRRLPEDFVENAVSKCIPSETTSDTRVVLVLDEYETLFGDLRSSLRPRPELRYSVVQPLLNQLVAFARDNLLVLMGQQPNAHFILLDQNQLSPIVEQDSFPLFPHDESMPVTGEFYELLAKVMTAHVELEPEFVNAVYRETSGHPFLTVKLMLTFMDWLIEKKRLMSDLTPIRSELLFECLAEELQPRRIARNRHFEFFRYAAAEHLSADGRRLEPWLNAAYTSLRLIGLSSPDSMSISFGDLSQALARNADDIAPHDLLATASRANFLTTGADDDQIKPRIPLLARISAAATQR